MKNKKILIMIIMMLIISITCSSSSKAFIYANQKDIADKIIRFHVIANSDNVKDQALKMTIKDKVIEYMQPKLDKSLSVEESREIIRKNDEDIKKIAQDIIKNNGYDYKVTTALSKENFPPKSYGSITLPQGEYEAYRIIIGSGEGRNWWCVMFPPLCFVDISRGEVADKETQEKIKSVLTKEEYEVITDENSKCDIKFKFKIVEIFKKLKGMNMKFNK